MKNVRLKDARKFNGNTVKKTEIRPVFETQSGQLYNCDCLTLLPLIQDESIDLIFADPPFNLGKDYGINHNDNLTDYDYIRWCHSWLDEIVRLLKPGGSFFLYNLPKWNLLLGSYISNHLHFRHWIAVDIKFSLPISGRLYPSHYSLLYFTKGTKPNVFNPPRLPLETCRHCGGELKDYGGYKNKMNPKGVNLTDVWKDIPPVRHKKYKSRKTNELSLKLLDRILDMATREGDLVLDPFGGGGTTYLASELKYRKWIGCEITDCQPIIDRFSKIEDEREHLSNIRRQLNTLFTEDTLKLREKHQHDTSKYRILRKVK